MQSDIALWQVEGGPLVPKDAKTPAEIASYAAQLSPRDKHQIVTAFQASHFEMGLTFLWNRTIAALKKELSTVGIALLGEMLGRVDVDEDDDVDDILTAKDAIRLAGELGIVSTTDTLRLQHTSELLTHFTQLGLEDANFEEIEESEAISALRTCIKSVLGRPKVEVAKKFVEFRDALEGETLTADDPRVEMLNGSPYFFYKLTVSVLMNGAKRNSGAQLEHVLANINVLVPLIWGKLRDAERWYVGRTYAEAYANGQTSAVSGLKSALLKIGGFDYVPENLRSETFIKAAEAIIQAHEGMNNFYKEAGPVNVLAKLGSTVPTPALAACISALLCVRLGNRYGTANNAVPEASQMLSKLSPERWQYYLNHVFPGDVRILGKLTEAKPARNWVGLVEKYSLHSLQLKNPKVVRLLRASKPEKEAKLKDLAKMLTDDYYNKAV